MKFFKPKITKKFLGSLQDDGFTSSSDTNIFPESIIWSKLHFMNSYYDDTTNFSYLLMMKGDESASYISDNKFDNISKKISEEYWDNPKLLDELKVLIKTDLRRAKNLYKKFTYEHIENSSVKDLQSVLPSLQNIMESKLFFACEDFPIDIQHIWEKASKPSFPSFHIRYDLLQTETLHEDENKRAEKLQFMFTGLIGAPTLGDVKKQLKKEFTKKPSQIKKEIEKEKKDHSLWLETLTSEEQKAVNQIQSFMELRDTRKDIHGMGLTIAHRITEKICKEAGLPPWCSHYLTYEELAKPLSYFKKNKKNILKRKEGFAYLINSHKNSHKSYNQNIDYEKTKKHLNSIITQNITELKGMVACKSKTPITGKVMVVESIKNHSFEEGKILVTAMTRPEFLPLMKKASAIITDEGGITSHAAVVARELNIPCIIGTDVATKLLHSGDIVEMNTQTGVIKKVN